jgi:hypothetical protein
MIIGNRSVSHDEMGEVFAVIINLRSHYTIILVELCTCGVELGAVIFM